MVLDLDVGSDMRLGRKKSDDAADAAPSSPAVAPAPAAPTPEQADVTEFDMTTVGIEPEPPLAVTPPPAAVPPPETGRRKGPLPPTATDINSVGVAILPGVPLPAWVAPVPAPVAQYPIDPAFAAQVAPDAGAIAPDVPPLAPPDAAAPWPSVTPDAAAAADPQLMPPPQLSQSQLPPPPMPVAAAAPPSVPLPPMAPPTIAAAPLAAMPAAAPLPPPDPAQWSEHPMGPVVWGPVPPLAAAPPEAPAEPAAPTPVLAAAPPIDATPDLPPTAPASIPDPVPAPNPAWFQTDVDSSPPAPADAAGQEYNWLVHPTDPGDDLTALAPPPVDAPLAPLAAPLALVAPEQELNPAPVAESPTVTEFREMAPPTGPALDFTPPSDLTTPTDASESDPADVAETTDSDDDGNEKTRGGALKWILIVGGILIAAALAAMALFVTPGFLTSSQSTTDTPAVVATPATAGGLTKAAEPAQPATGVFQKMAADTSAASGSQYATYTGGDVAATVWVSPTFGGSPTSIAQAYSAAGGVPLDKAATVPAGPKGGSMQCAAASPQQTLCFWTADGVRGAADVTGLGRSAAGELVGKMRVALEPTTTS